MAVTLILPHCIDINPNRLIRHNWLWYSHGDAPTDRQVVSGWQDPTRPGMRMARHYFLTDHALMILTKGYQLNPHAGLQWHLDINDRAEAVIFKLTFV